MRDVAKNADGGRVPGGVVTVLRRVSALIGRTVLVGLALASTALTTKYGPLNVLPVSHSTSPNHQRTPSPTTDSPRRVRTDGGPRSRGSTSTPSSREHAEYVERESGESHHPQTREQPAGEPLETEREGNDRSILRHASYGAIATTGAYSVPGLNLFAPVFGGFVAGYLEKETAWRGMKAGALKGVLMIFPAVAFALLAGSILAGVPIIGNYLAGSLALIVLVIVGHSIKLGVIGGFLGGMVAENTADRRRPRR